MTNCFLNTRLSFQLTCNCLCQNPNMERESTEFNKSIFFFIPGSGLIRSYNPRWDVQVNLKTRLRPRRTLSTLAFERRFVTILASKTVTFLPRPYWYSMYHSSYSDISGEFVAVSCIERLLTRMGFVVHEKPSGEAYPNTRRWSL